MVPVQSPRPGGPRLPVREADAPLRGGADAAGQRAKQESVRLNYGSLYAVVESLEKNGFIKATGTVQEGKRPQRTIYAITDAGAIEMTDWLTELIGTPTKEYPAFMAGLSFLPALDPDDALAALQRRAEAPHREARLPARRACRRRRDAGLPRIFELETEYEEQPARRRAAVRHGPRRRDGRPAPSRASTCGGCSSPTTSTPRRCTSPSSSPRNDDPEPRAGHTRPRAHTTTSPIHEGPSPEAATRKRRRPPSSGLCTTDERRRADGRAHRGRRPHEEVREGPGPRRTEPHPAAGPAGGHPRAQRRGEDHLHPHGGHAASSPTAARCASTGTTSCATPWRCAA